MSANFRSIQDPSREVFCSLNPHCPMRLSGRAVMYRGWMFPIRMEDLVKRGFLSEVMGDDLPVPTLEGRKYFCRQCGRKIVSLPVCHWAYHSRNLAIIPNGGDLTGYGIRTDVNFPHVLRR